MSEPVPRLRRGAAKAVKKSDRGGSKRRRVELRSKERRSKTGVAEVYDGQLDDVGSAWLAITMIVKSKPPSGCVWRVDDDSARITVAAMVDGEVQVELSGEYRNPETGLWRDPGEVAERLAQAVLYSAAAAQLSTFKGYTA